MYPMKSEIHWGSLAVRQNCSKKKMDPEDRLNGIADIIVAESRRLNDIITDFLDYARPKGPQPKSHAESMR